MSPAHGFETFGTAHLAALALTFALAMLLPLAVRRGAPGLTRPVAILLAVLLLGQEAVQSVLLLPGQRIYEVAYYWGIGGGLQALLTPDLADGFPSWRFLLFFLGHGLVVVGVVYATVALRLRPRPVSLLTVPMLTLGYAALILALNLWLDTNFLYLMAKPAQGSLLDWFGPWPWYWLGLVLAALLSFAVLYSPFLAQDLRRGSAG
ncbi:MAG: TIGR02206 family membrane protein, partial [Thiohalocapsa sp.]